MKNTVKLLPVAVIFITTLLSYAQSTYSKTAIKNASAFIKKNDVKAEIHISDSETLKGYKNLEFKLSNGMSFNYEDGNYKAGYKNKILDVKGKYSITSEVGTLSLAFNADDGSIWWVFKEKTK